MIIKIRAAWFVIYYYTILIKFHCFMWTEYIYKLLTYKRTSRNKPRYKMDDFFSIKVSNDWLDSSVDDKMVQKGCQSNLIEENNPLNEIWYNIISTFQNEED